MELMGLGDCFINFQNISSALHPNSSKNLSFSRPSLFGTVNISFTWKKKGIPKEFSFSLECRHLGKIGLANFHYRRRVPGFISSACPCGWHRQTPKHAIMHCQLMSERSVLFREAGTRDYQKLTKSSKPLKSLTAWLMKSGILTQLSLATELLYQQ